MNLIINCSDIKATGATQVSISFINECLRYPENNYFIFMSRTIGKQISKSSFPQNFKFYEFDYKPFYWGGGLKSWKRLIKLESEINPDCVFSVFGPSVWKPKGPHLMGYAYPYYVYPESPFFKMIGIQARLKIQLHKLFHKYYLERNGKYYVCETNDVASRLPQYINCDNEKVFTITNSFNHFFINYKGNEQLLLPSKEVNEFRLVTLSSFSFHKNLTILNKVIPELKRQCPSVNFKFVLTVDEKLFEERFDEGVKSSIINLGRINASDCPQVYLESDAMFLPTLMECFSASYAEAMQMEKPILTSNLPFAKTVCDNAAIYFNPLNPKEIVSCIIKLSKDSDKIIELVKRGKERLATFDTAETRARKYLELCRKIM
jgi:glycosyltransferase involved in cell wall biosynthesis